jgi:hypothetical protein
MQAYEWATAVLLGAALGVALRAESDDRGPVNKGLEMSIRLARPSSRVDEPVVLEVVIRNTKPEEVSLGMSADDQASFDIEVRYVGGGMTQSGRMPLTKYGVRRFSFFDAAKNIEIRLKGHEERRYSFPLSRMYDMTLSGTYSVKANRLIPGRHRYDGEGRVLPTDRAREEELISNELTVERAETPVSN